jgi:3'-phosphoadenosine 5'-phosphosulfate sulfotransferase (PAPS reductase)/FAD synthetase
VSDPFLITGPALISFSGGRTSGYMLWRILQAHGGTLPADVVVAFANTGKEHEATLRFVHEVGSRWRVPVRWIEWRGRTGEAASRWTEVNFNSASRNGEPFMDLIVSKKFTPNAIMRFCTEEMKVNTLRLFARSLGFVDYVEAIGLRADEPWRLAKMLGRNAESGRRCVAPLGKAGLTVADVTAFWAAQDFDLELGRGAGNCDLCFLKARSTLVRLIQMEPARADWWIAAEAAGGGRFRNEYSYAELKAAAVSQADLFDVPAADEDDGECGLICAVGEAA